MASKQGGGAGRPALRVGRTKEYRMGRDTQLLETEEGSAPVSLFVLCGDRFEDAQLFRSGALSVHMIRVESHPVSMASCTVGDHQWMLARDALVARLDDRVFVFELPGFFYAVVVPSDSAGGSSGGVSSQSKCATLAEIFSRFCAYQDLSNAEGVEEAGDQDQQTNPWVRAHTRIQRLKRSTTPPGGRAMADVPAAIGSARQMERAVRTSAVVKLLNRSLLAGALQPARHLTITLGVGVGSAAAGTSAISSTAFAAALPSKSVVADLLDAIETSRASTPRRDARRNGQACWSLNVEGVMLLVRVVQAIRGRRQPVITEAATKRPRDEGSGDAGHDGLKGGGGGGGSGGAAAFAGNAVRRWCGANQGKVRKALGAYGRS